MASPGDEAVPELLQGLVALAGVQQHGHVEVEKGSLREEGLCSLFLSNCERLSLGWM